MTIRPALLDSVGESYEMMRGVMPYARILTASDGSNAEDIVLDANEDSITMVETPTEDGFTYAYSGTYTTTNYGALSLNVVVTANGNSTEGFDISVTWTSLPTGAAIRELGIAFDLKHVADGSHRIMLPFGGGVIYEDPATLLASADGDTQIAASMSIGCYWSRDRTGLYWQMLDPVGHKPKHFVYSSTTFRGDPGTLIKISSYIANDNVAGVAKSSPVQIRLRPFYVTGKLEAGWEEVAKIYRAWMTTNAVEAGKILERGRVSSRSDIPSWLRTADLFISELFGWYPTGATVSDPLNYLTGYQTELGVGNAVLALWDWGDATAANGYGYAGSFYPRADAITQFATLKAEGIYVTGYQWPFGMDTNNGFLAGLSGARVQNREGVDQTEVGGTGTIAQMDVANADLETHYEELATTFASANSVNGFYYDLPVAAHVPDYVRPEGEDVGISEHGGEGYAAILSGSVDAAAVEGEGWATYHEVAFERNIRCATLGQGSISTFNRQFTNNPLNYGIPFLNSVFSGYTMFWPADPGLGVQTLAAVPTAYGPFDEFNISRLQAEGAVLGGIPNTSEISLNEGTLFFELNYGDPTLDSWLQHHKKTLTNVIAMRAGSRAWIVDGEMLRDIWVGGQTDEMTINVSDALAASTNAETWDKRRVHVRAWEAEDGTVRVFCANGSYYDGSAVVDLSLIGLKSVRTLVDVDDPYSTGGTVVAVRDGGRWVFPLSVAAGECRVFSVLS